MEKEGQFSFPLYHRVGRALGPIMGSRYWIAVVLAISVLLYVPFLFSGFFQDDYGFRLQFAPEILERNGVPADLMLNGPLNLYGFSWDSSERFLIQQDHGFAPWWASDQIKTNFFRPLSSLTLALDFTLWPDTPLLMHIHSLLWFVLLIWLAYRLYRSISGSAVVAGISILLLALDDVFTGPVGWISNRHAVMAMVFAVLCVWLYHLGVSKQKWSCIAWSSGAYALALLASEMGLVTFAYLFAYLLVLDRGRWLDRIKRIAPFVLLTVVWRLAYTSLGYGATGTFLYIDPILDPVNFVAQLLTRYPALLFSDAGLPIVDLILGFSPQGAAVAAVVCLVLLVLLALIVFPVLRAQRTAAFWFLGLLGALVPLVSGIPQNRNLGMVSLGVMALAGQIFVEVAAAPRPGPLNTFQVVLLKIATPTFVILHLVLSPIMVLANPGTTQAMAEDQASAANFGSMPGLTEKHLYVINPPGAMSFMGGLFQRLFADEPFPKTINYLSSGFAPVEIERVDDVSIRVTPEGGYTPLPGPILDEATGTVSHFTLENVYRWLDGFYYNPSNPMQVGQVVDLSDVTVEVTQMTGDGRIAQASFTFAHPLDDDQYLWLLWDADSASYHPVEIPSIGETRVYP